ncbi:MAG TPA: hypothetical protein VFP98_04690 [Candidatus Polarisedimenticolia bacterium]|nr:hypothetical protein [Candidatus Polarisedimenticolia bacterium]
MKIPLRVTAALSIALLALVALATPAQAASKKNLTKVFFLNMGVQAGAHGKLMMIENRAQTFFKINLKRMAPGTYDVVLNGAIVDTIIVDASGEGQLRYRHRTRGKGAGTPLPYDPSGSEIAIQAAGIAILAANIPATPEEAFLKTEIVIDLTNLGVAPGHAEAEFEARFGRMEFEVEVEDAAPGVYELMVDGVKVADITVDASGRGEVEFDSRPSTDDDGDDLDLLLTFDPRGKSISVMQNATDLFSATFPMTPIL